MTGIEVRILVDEGGVLLRVEHLKESCGWVAMDTPPQLVHLVQEEDRVIDSHCAKSGQDTTRQGTNVCSPAEGGRDRETDRGREGQTNEWMDRQRETDGGREG